MPAIYEAVPVGLFLVDRDLRFVSINRRMAEMTGRPAAGDIGRSLAEVTPGVAAQLEPAVRRALQGERVADLELRGTQAGTVCEGRVFLASLEPMRGADGTVEGVLCSALDITDRKRAGAALQESEARLARAIAAGRMSVWEWDIASDALHTAAGFDALFGRPPGSLRTMRAALAAVHADDLGRISAAIERAMRSERGEDQETEFRVIWPDGTIHWLHAQGSAERDASGEPVRLAGITHDITERKRLQDENEYLARFDPLTGLVNRAMFRRRLESMLDAFDGRSGLAALHWLDFDQFKGVNDTLGHPAGDALLCEAARRLQQCVSENDVVARIGGDEFAVIQFGLCSPRDATFLAQRMTGAVDAPFDIDGRQVHVSVSVGIAIIPGDGLSANEVVKKADIALYRAKADGRGAFRLFAPEMDEAVRRKQELVAGLHTALAQDELELHFQPLVSTRSGGVTCFEALLRWRHKVHGLVPATDFIPLAEEAGSVVPIGAWVLRTACREAAGWPAPARVAVNLSPAQFRKPGLLRTVTDALAASGLPAERLELEITESVLLQHDEANLAILRQLRELGVHIVLDDFGTGFSSLGYLLRFPFDKIKIDRSFITGLPDREDSMEIVRAVIGLGRSLGISVTAEGVETAAQLRALRRKGCGEAQGFLFSHPVPARDVAGILHHLRLSEDPAAPAGRKTRMRKRPRPVAVAGAC